MDLDLGFVVKLKSGGPSMTICGISSVGHSGKVVFQCKWFNEHILLEGVFAEDALKYISGSE